MTRFDQELALIHQSGLFDREWYLSEYLDVKCLDTDPVTHYLWLGATLLRDPSPNFSTRNYLENNPDVATSGMNPLVHFIMFGKQEGRATAQANALQRLIGAKRRKEAVRTLLVCGHAIGSRLFGGERSLLDILDAFATLQYNVVVTIPGRQNEAYLQALRALSCEVIIFDYRWWRKGEAMSDQAIAAFEQIIAEERVDAVHTNTIMLREPLVAARHLGVPAVVHARELIPHDRGLCELIGETPGAIVGHVLSTADYIIANSEATGSAFTNPGCTYVVPNPVDAELLNIANPLDPEHINIGMISSNLPKKGIFDFVEIARRLQRDVPGASLLLIGPENAHTAALREGQARGHVPRNLKFPGYLDDPVAAVRETNVVVNLSHFQESFGRTILEAMAARRAVLVYDWGALPELVRNDETGFVVPFRDIASATRRIRELCQNPGKLMAMGEAGRRRAVALFNKDRYASRLEYVYGQIFARREERPDTISPRSGESRLLPVSREARVRQLEEREASLAPAPQPDRPTISVVIPNYNYSRYLKDRIDSITQQSYLPSEIIFIDDFSTDDSVEIAKPLLEASGVPYTVIRNGENIGTYRSWTKGLTQATGDFVWIAEADDICDPEFLESLTQEIDPSVVIAYTQSRKIDEEGALIAPNNREHTDAVDRGKWARDYVECGTREVLDALAYRNTIPNVSACLLKTEVALTSAAFLEGFRYCGDWFLYAHMLRAGKIAFVSRALNSFRRHAASHTRQTNRSVEYLVEISRVREFICKSFPIQEKHLSRMDEFFNRDYRIQGVEVNTSCPAVLGRQIVARKYAAGRREIAFITTNNGSYFGGSEVLWREAALALRRRGHDVSVLIKKWEPRPDFFEDFETAGIQLFFKEDGGFDAVVDQSPDLVVLSLGDQDEGTEYYHALHSRKISYVIVNQLTKEERFWPIRYDRQEAVRAGYINAATCFFTCRNNQRVMEARLRARLENADMHFNPFHIDRSVVPEFPPFGSIQLAVPAKLLFLHKGQDILAGVLKSGKWKRRSIVTNIYGIGPDRASLEQMAAEYGIDNMIFHGRLPDISEIWRVNHAIVMPSRMEGLPIMLVSAMLSARVPIVTNVGGHAELIEDGSSGFLAADPSEEALDDALERAYTARHEWENIGQRARQSVVRFLPEDPVEDFVSKIAAILDRHVAPRAIADPADAAMSNVG